VSRDGEAYMPRELVYRVLECAADDVILVGGQALAYWMDRYRVRQPGDRPAISRDVDFYTPNAANSAPLELFARAIGGRAEVESASAITALIGSAIAPAEDSRVYNVDLLHAVVGLERDHIEANAVVVEVPGGRTTFRVLHPLDVLQSRNANLHELPEKQDETGRLQFRLAIEVAREYLEARIEEILDDATLTDAERERAVFDLIAPVNEYSTEDAARKNAERYGIHLADAIPAWRITAPVFWEKQWPFLRQRMSAEYARQCEEWAGKAGAS
jgi:hypothetical protein